MSQLDKYAAMWTESLLKSLNKNKPATPVAQVTNTHVAPVTQEVAPVTQINPIEVSSITPARITCTTEDLWTESLLKSMNSPKKVAPVSQEVTQQEVIQVIQGVTIIREITQVTQEVNPVTQVASITPITPARIIYSAEDLKSHRPNAAPFQKEAISDEVAQFVLPKPKVVSPNVTNGNSTLIYRPGFGFEPGVSADGYIDPEVQEQEKFKFIIDGVNKSCQAATETLNLISANKMILARLEVELIARVKEAQYYEAEMHAFTKQAEESLLAKKAEEERLAAEKELEEDRVAAEQQMEEDRLAALKKEEEGLTANNPKQGIKMVAGVKMVYVGSGVYLEADDPDFAEKWHAVPYDQEENRSCWDPKHPRNLAAAKGLTFVPKRKYFIGQNRDGTMPNGKRAW